MCVKYIPNNHQSGFVMNIYKMVMIMIIHKMG